MNCKPRMMLYEHVLVLRHDPHRDTTHKRHYKKFLTVTLKPINHAWGVCLLPFIICDSQINSNVTN